MAHIPTHWLGTGEPLRVPIVLQPDPSDVPPPVCRALFNQQIPCSTSQKAICFRDRFKARFATETCVQLNTSTKLMLFGWLPVTPAPELGLSSLVTVQPSLDATWGGKLYTNCGG